MTDREKLIELLRPWLAHLSLCAANDLIANGVTFAGLESSRVEVVRCRDCKYRKTERCQMYWESEDGREQYNWETDDDFCSSGKRRDEHSWKR